MSNPPLSANSPPTLRASTLWESASASSTSLHVDHPPEKEALVLRRSLAVYPHAKAFNNRTPYAESAKRRNSLQSLGSIAHLQHMYTRHGLASKVKPGVLGRAQPALGQAAVVLLTGEEGVLPKTPLAPTHFSQNAESSRSKLPSLEEIKQEAIAAWTRCCQSWFLVDLLDLVSSSTLQDGDRDDGSNADTEVEVHHLISVTREAIGRIRNYLLAVPQEKVNDDVTSKEQPSGTGRARPAFRRQSSFSCSPRREVGYSNIEPTLSARPSLTKQKSEGNLQEDGSAAHEPAAQTQWAVARVDAASVRHVALDLLVQLKQLEGEQCQKEKGANCLLDVSFSDLSLASRDGGDVQLDVQGVAVSMKHLMKERECVRQYLQLVLSILGKMREEDEDDASAQIHISPPWSTYEAIQGLSGALEVLRDFVSLDDDVLLRLDNEERRPVLEALSDGKILCQAFNGAVSASTKPWGLIKTSDIDHLDSNRTFRKRHNLTVWTAALRARYSISAAAFDVIMVAKGGPAEDWMDMLQGMICKWAHVVAREYTA